MKVISTMSSACVYNIFTHSQAQLLPTPDSSAGLAQETPFAAIAIIEFNNISIKC